jgi:signal recognition particle subunit SRP14
MAPDTAPRLSNADFLARLTTLFTSTHSANSGSIFLTQKPLYPSSPDTQDSHPSAAPPQILIRATDGKSPPPKSTAAAANSKSAKGITKKTSASGGKVKFSTVVDAEELEGFFTKYAEVCKGGMVGLKKRDRKKAKKKGKGAGEKAGKGK